MDRNKILKFDSAFSFDQSMTSDPNLIHYACISKGTTILAEFSSGDRILKIQALECLEKIPPFHATFSHTIKNMIYNILIDDSFVYFAILDESFGKPQGFQFLRLVKDAFMNTLKMDSIKEWDNLTFHCFHEELSPIFSRLMISSNRLRALRPPDVSRRDSQNGSLDSKSGKYSKKKKLSDEMNDRVKDIPIENEVDVLNDVNLRQDFSMSLQKNGFYMENGGCQHAKKMWRQQVWKVLVIDFVVCCVLLGVWLLVCRGFECIAS